MPKNSKSKKAKPPVQEVNKSDKDIMTPYYRYTHLVDTILSLKMKILDEFNACNLSSIVWSESLKFEISTLTFFQEIYSCFDSLKLLFPNAQLQFPFQMAAKLSLRASIQWIVWIVNTTVKQTHIGESIGDNDEEYRSFFISRNVLDVLGLVIQVPRTVCEETQNAPEEKPVKNVPLYPSEQFFWTIIDQLPKNLQDSFRKDLATKKKKKGKKAASQQPSTSSAPMEQVSYDKEKRERIHNKILDFSQRIQWKGPEEKKHFEEHIDKLEQFLCFDSAVFDKPDYELKITKYVARVLLNIVNQEDSAGEELKSMKEKLKKIEEELDEKDKMISERTTRISELTSNSVRNTSSIKNKEDEIAQRDRKIEELTEQMRRTNASKEEANYQKNKSKKEAVEKDQKIRALEKQIKDLLRLEDQRVKKIEASTEERFQATIDSQSEELHRKNDEAESWKLRFEKERNDHMEEIASVLSEKQRVFDEFSTEIGAVNAQKQSLVKDYTDEIESVRAENQRLFENYSNEIEAVKVESRRLAEAYQQLNDDFKNEKKKNYEKNQKIQLLNSEVASLQYITFSGQSNTSSSSSSPPFVGQATATARSRQYAGRAQQTNVDPRWQFYQHGQRATSEYNEFNAASSDPAHQMVERWNAQKSSRGHVDQSMVDEVQMFYGSMNSSWQAAQNGGESSNGRNVQEEIDRIERLNIQLEAELERARNGHGTSFSSNSAHQSVGRTQHSYENGGQSQWPSTQNGQGTSSNHMVGGQVVGQVGGSSDQLVPEYPPPVPFDVCLPPNHDKRLLLTVFEPTGDNCVGFSLLNKDNGCNKYF